MPRLNLYQEEYYPSPIQNTWKEFKENHAALLSLYCVIFFIFLMIFGPFLAPYDPLQQNIDLLLVPPAWDNNGDISYLFGTDGLGRDMLSRIIYGCRMTFGISLVLVIISMLVGVALGLSLIHI